MRVLDILHPLSQAMPNTQGRARGTNHVTGICCDLPASARPAGRPVSKGWGSFCIQTQPIVH